MSISIKDKVAIVTGASSGIGMGIAVRFLQEGAKVVFAVRKLEETRKIAEATGISEANWLIQYCDVKNLNDIKDCVEASVKRFGRLDVMVANAGLQLRKPFQEITPEEYDEVLNTNLRGEFFCAQEAAKAMIAQQHGGSIILMGSVAAVQANPNVSTYGASKGGIRALTTHAALDLGQYGIRVNCIAPGTVRSNINKYRLEDPKQVQASKDINMLNILAEPEDCGGLAVFLASDDSRYVTGEHIMLDGGSSVKAAPLWVRE